MKTIPATVYRVDGQLTTTAPSDKTKPVYYKGAVVSEETYNSIQFEPCESQASIGTPQSAEVLAPPHNFTQNTIETSEEYKARLHREKEAAKTAPKTEADKHEPVADVVAPTPTETK